VETPNLILMLLIGIIFGGIAAVFLRGKRSVFIVNILLGVIGASVGAFFHVIMGNEAIVNTETPAYLIRALLGSFMLVLIASLFRSVKPPTINK